MALVTRPDIYLTKGTPTLFTLDKAALLLHPKVAADPYFSNPLVWASVEVKYGASEGSQFKYLKFDTDSATPTSSFITTPTSRDQFLVILFMITDLDGGALYLPREDLVAQEFDFGIDQGPMATEVNISGTTEVGSTLTCNYTYLDLDGDLEGVTTFQWYRADDIFGVNETLIAGEVASTYLLDAADLNKRIRCEVTPLALTGISPGVTESSTFSAGIE